MKLVTPLSKAKGMGAAKDGTEHFWQQRLTALILIPLSLWLGFSLAALPQADYSTVLEWLQSPFNSIALILFLMTSLYHGQMGVQVVIEDYIASTPLKLTLIIANKLLSLIAAVVAVFAIIKLAIA